MKLFYTLKAYNFKTKEEAEKHIIQMRKYVMNSDNKPDLTDENAGKYIPYEYTHCNL